MFVKFSVRCEFFSGVTNKNYSNYSHLDDENVSRKIQTKHRMSSTNGKKTQTNNVFNAAPPIAAKNDLNAWVCIDENNP